MSYVFGLVTVGTVLKNENLGNVQKPKEGIKRLIVDPKNETIINSQGYPSQGLDYIVDQLKRNHKNRNKKSKLILSFSGTSGTLNPLYCSAPVFLELVGTDSSRNRANMCTGCLLRFTGSEML